MDVATWLRGLGLERYEQAFHENEIDAEILPTLTPEDLGDLGVTIVGHRRKILNAIEALNAGAATDAAPAQQPGIGGANLAARGPIADAERRTLTVMFCDLVGSTELSRRLDPEDLRDIMRRYQDAVAGAITRYGGHVAKYLGDGILAYFGWPQAYEDQAERAVRAGLDCASAVNDVQGADQSALAVRVGIATGQVVVGDLIGESGRDAEAVTGATPNLAARLQNVAAQGQVVIDPATRRLVGRTFTVDDLGGHALKGFDTAVQVWRVVDEVKAESRFEATHGATLTHLVGRAAELRLLLDRWDLAQGGEGQAVVISGEAGIGKSRLIEGLCAELEAGEHIRIRYQCSPYHVDTALYPSAQQLARAARFADDDDADAKLDKLEALLDQAGYDASADAPLFADLLSLPCDDRYGKLSLPPQRIKERLLEGMISQLLKLAEQRPVLYLFEDAHWIDPTSMELLEQVIERLQHARVLLIVTHRPEWHRPDSGHGHITGLQLNRLGRGHAADIVRSIAGENVADDIVERIVTRTDGVPLFLEELTKSLVEGGLDVADAEIPATLQASLLVRLDRLPPETKKIAQIGAVIGRDFTHDLIAAIAEIDDAGLDDALVQLVKAELILRRGSSANATYTFKHALVQAAAYDSLLLSNRRRIHEAIAEVLHTQFPHQARSNPELLAYHLNEAGLSEQAVPYWQEAGDRAARVSANAEAVGHLTRGLAALERLEKTPERDALALELTFALVSPLAAAKGYSSSEMEDAVAKALALCERTGETARMFLPLYGRWSMHHVRGQPRICLERAREFMSLARNQPDPVPRAVGHRMLGTSCLMGGDIVGAREHLAGAMTVLDSEMGGALDISYAQELGVSIHCYDALALAMLGYPDQARRQSDEAMKRARDADHPNTLCFALWHCGQWLAWLLRDIEMLDRANGELALVSAEHSLPIWSSWVAMFAGIVSGWRGATDRALEQLADGYREMEYIQAMSPRDIWHLVQTEFLIASGCLDAAHGALDRSFADIGTSGLCWLEPEFHRARHRLSLARPDGARDEAEAHLRRAIKTAKLAKTRLFELRATTDLARLLQAKGDTAGAVAMLEPLHGGFTEGFGTPDLEDAEALLASLT